MVSTGLANTIAQHTAMGLRHTLSDYMTDSNYRKYLNWALSEENPQYLNFHKLIGLSQLSNMTANLVEGILEEDQVEQFLPYVVDMNVYQLYEVVSDNIAIGLAEQKYDDKTFMSRRHLLYLFNLTMVDALEHQQLRPTPSVDNIQWLAQHISAFEQSLNYQAHKKMATAYIKVNSEFTLDALEYHLCHELEANILSALHLYQSVQHHPTHAIFLETLIERYRATNLLLAEIPVNLEDLSKIGTNTILVVPTLVFYIGVLAEIKNLNAGLTETIDSGMLYEALEQTALLIRIINDLGTDIAMSKPEVHPAILEVLTDLHSTDEFVSRITQSKQMNVFTRIQKDLIYGEFNIALHDVHRGANPSAITDTLKRNFDFFTAKYQYTRANLVANLAEITDTVGDPFIEQLIMRFVIFHEHLYSNDFRSSKGEYAI